MILSRPCSCFKLRLVRWLVFESISKKEKGAVLVRSPLPSRPGGGLLRFDTLFIGFRVL